MNWIDAARGVLTGAIGERVFPAATVEVGSSGNVLWAEAFGSLTFGCNAKTSCDTVFDLASLTKPIATTTVAMQLVHGKRLRLEDTLPSFFPEWVGIDRDQVTVQDLLEHASGLAARLVDTPPEGRREFEHDICTMGLEYPPRTRSVYSDLGFILLGFLLSDCGGAPLDAQFDAVWRELRAAAGTGADQPLTFDLAREERRRAAPTRPMTVDPRRGRRLAGEVHDNYAAALGGLAGHAGLFGTAPAVGAFARLVLRAARGDRSLTAPLVPELVARFTARSTVPESSRTLGWDTMLPSSSCGTRMSPQAFGHAGFTGTSLWIDPFRDRYFVLLTNRAWDGGTLEQIREVRRRFHDALGEL
jgi:serine-type D-Ala-D-Ala carboxypeptidase